MTEKKERTEKKTAADKTEKTVKKQASSEKKEVKPAEAKQPETVIGKKVDDPFSIIKFVLMTEKAVQVIEKQNKLVFIVDRAAEKGGIKNAVEAAFSSPISGVQTMVDQSGRKKAFVKFKNAGAAGDIAIKLGII